MENLIVDKTEELKTDDVLQQELEQKSEQDSEQETVQEIENSPEVKIETPSESTQIKTEDANTTNCLALTIQKDHKLVAMKNVFFRSIRMSWKVVVSAITLALIKLFS